MAQKWLCDLIPVTNLRGKIVRTIGDLYGRGNRGRWSPFLLHLSLKKKNLFRFFISASQSMAHLFTLPSSSSSLLPPPPSRSPSTHRRTHSVVRAEVREIFMPALSSTMTGGQDSFQGRHAHFGSVGFSHSQQKLACKPTLSFVLESGFIRFSSWVFFLP